MPVNPVTDKENTTQEASNDASMLASPESIEILISGISDSVIIANTDGTIHVFNPSAEKLFGYSADEVQGESVRLLMTAFDAERFHDRIGRFSNGEPTRLINEGFKEVVARHKKGNTIMINLSIKTVKLEGETYFLCIANESTYDLPTAEDLHKAADHDILTGLYNRNYMSLELNRAADRCQRNPDRQAAILRINIDRFSSANDKYGYTACDAILIEVAERLKARLRKSDLACRLTGDEFAILAYDVKPGMVETVAQAFHSRISAPMTIEGKEISVSSSIGVYIIDGKILDAEPILLKADEACKVAKRLGGNRIRINATPSL
ncbi:MAG: sensor domain-containing diguanylate cyclase [Proteobacteria bacterium]|nr:sensor domain-containing diguanylate cyclase [Pseudomonadota bacterium]